MIRQRAISMISGTVVMVLAMLMLGDVHSASAQQGASPQHASISIEQAHDAFAAARRWITAFETPRMDDAASRVNINHASAVCVILRRHGKTMGVGTDDRSDALMLRRAVGRAMNEALADTTVQSLLLSARREAADAMDADRRINAIYSELGRSLTLELDVAGPRLPLVGATLTAKSSKVEPGIDGLSMVRDRTWSHVFPAQLRAMNLAGDAQRSLSSLALNAGFTLVELSQPNALADASVYVFRTINLAQERPDAEAHLLFRGEQLLHIDDITPKRVQQAADGIVTHMLTCRFPDPPAGEARLPLGFMGDYAPAGDQFSPTIASPLEQALCALALTRYAQGMNAAGDLAREAAVAARQALRDLAEVVDREAEPADDAAACAVLMMIAADMPSCMGDSSIAALMRRAHARLADMFDATTGFADKAHEHDANPQRSPAMTGSMIAYAWSRLLHASVDGLPAPPHSVVRAALDAVWESTPPSQHVALLPWIGWAEADCAQAAGEPLARIEHLKRLHDALRLTQITEADAEPADLLGGLALTGSAAGPTGRLLPTAQSARPGAWLASTVANEAIVAVEHQPDAWQSQRQLARFLCQLAVSPVRAATTRNPGRSLGGIAASPWDSRQPVAAQAMALLAMLETLRSWPEDRRNWHGAQQP